MKPPILKDFPRTIVTERLTLRIVEPGDGKKIYQAAQETKRQLQRWMPWAQGPMNDLSFEEFARRGLANFILRTDFMFVILDRRTAKVLGCGGIHRIDWDVPKMEIGYWLRKSAQGKGYAKEAASAFAYYAFDYLKTKRLEIRCDVLNVPSQAVARGCNFEEEALKKNDLKPISGKSRRPRSTLIFVCFKKSQLPKIKKLRYE